MQPLFFMRFVAMSILLLTVSACRRESPAERMARIANEARYVLATTIVPLEALESIHSMRIFAASHTFERKWWLTEPFNNRYDRIHYSGIAPLHKAIVLINIDKKDLSRIVAEFLALGMLLNDDYHGITRRIQQLNKIAQTILADPEYQKEEVILQELEAQDSLRSTIAGSSGLIAATMLGHKEPRTRVKITPSGNSDTTVIVH